MMRRLFPVALCLMALTSVVFIGCSDDETTPTGNNNNTTDGVFDVTFTEFGGLVEAIAPPVYTGPVGAPVGEWDSNWTDGSYPLLGKVFGEDEPMSLYWNTAKLDETIAMLDMIAGKFDSAGVTGDTVMVMPEGTVEYRSLDATTDIPTECQGVFGFSAAQMDNIILADMVQGSDTMHYDLGYTVTDSTQAYLSWFQATGMQDEGVSESFLYYAFVNLNDSSIEFKGVFFKDYGDGTSARWVYDIQTVDESDFTYRMSWYADDFGDESGLGCVVGGGNKDDEFAMKYRQYKPADTAVVDSVFLLEQMFNADYEYLGAIATGYEDFVDEANIFTIEYQPTALIPSPWEE